MNGFLYSNLNEELASHGYVVAAVDHPGAALFVAYPDESVVTYSEPGPDHRDRIADRAADLRFVRDQVRRLEIRGRRLEDVVSERIGAFGHSSGGLAAGLLCQQPPLVDACLNMDGRWAAAPIVTGAGISVPSKPFMYVTKPFRTLTDSELQAQGLTRDQAANAQNETWVRDGRLLGSASAPSYCATLYQAKHDSFSDEPLLRNPEDEKLAKLVRIIRNLIRSFFESTIGDLRKSLTLRSDDDVKIEILAEQWTREGPPN